MAAVDNVKVQSATDANGNSYTKSISNDKLTNDDFLKLMIQELKMQDPTKPMDADKMMDNQLKMSTIESNLDMSKAMESLKTSYTQSALSTAANLIGHIVEDGSIGDDGLVKSYKVETIENQDGELYANVRQLTGYTDKIVDSDGNYITYDQNGVIYDGDDATDYRVDLDANGRFILDDSGDVVILDENGEVVTDEDVNDRYNYGGKDVVYASETTAIPLENILKVR